MAEELSKVLDHIEKIRELDLEGVEPTSHVIDVVNALRATSRRRRSRARSSWRRLRSRCTTGSASRAPARRERADRPDRGAGRGADPRGGAIRRGAVRGLPGARGRGRAERVHVGRGQRLRSSDGHGGKPLGGVPIAVKDLFCTEGVPSQSGSKILEGYRPPYTATVVAKLQRGRRAAAGQDQPGRVRDGLLERELRLRAGAQPVGPHPGSRGLLGRKRRGGRGRSWRPGRSAPTPAARFASRRRCAGSSG